MTPQQAKIMLGQAISNKSQELEVLQLANNILCDTFEADLSALKVAQDEANALAVEKAQLANEKADALAHANSLTTQLDETITSLNAEQDAHEETKQKLEEALKPKNELPTEKIIL